TCWTRRSAWTAWPSCAPSCRRAATACALSTPGWWRPGNLGAVATYAGNLLIDYWDRLPAVIAARAAAPAWPGYDLPPLDEGLAALFAPATAAWEPVGEYRGHPLIRLDLARNPGTQTTKTFASLLIVARAVTHIRRTGESVMIVTPTSANKGVALRD